MSKKDLKEKPKPFRDLYEVRPKPEAMPKEVRLYQGYWCETCRGLWLVVKLNLGTIPSLSPCFSLEGCTGHGKPIPAPPGPWPVDLPLLIEWYSPRSVKGLSEEMRRHVNNGGLMRRATEGAPQWVKDLA